MSDSVHNLVIIGSGPAGLTAALYAGRADLNPVIIEGYEPGGQLMQTTEIENFPGYPDGVMGPEMIEDLRTQAKRFGTSFITGEVTSVDLSSSPFQLHLGDDVVSTRSLIIATGATARWLGLENEARLVGRGVSACATCDGFFFRDREVVVVGGGDTAMEEATFLTKFASKVTVVHRRDELRASQIMADRAKANQKIEFIWNAEVVDVLGDDAVTAVQLRDTKTGEEREYLTSGLFLAIGHDPVSGLFADQLKTDDAGYIVIDEPTTATTIPGVFAAGDITDTIYRQAITASGQGCKAAIDAERWLEANDVHSE